MEEDRPQKLQTHEGGRWAAVACVQSMAPSPVAIMDFIKACPPSGCVCCLLGSRKVSPSICHRNWVFCGDERRKEETRE